ncbi:---NA---, partial [Paramuricea clavata]
VSWNEIPIRQVEQKSRFPGQWLLINCSVNTSEKVTLWFKKNKTSEEEPQVIDKKKIISASKNIFNIKRLTYMDKGYYICRVRELEKEIFLSILE